MEKEQLAAKYLLDEYGFEFDGDSLGNDPQVVASYYAFVAGYEAARIADELEQRG